MQVSKRRSDFAHDAEHPRDVVRTGTGQSSTDRFAGDPAAEIPGSAPTFGKRRPVVIRGGDRRMAAMRNDARLGLGPGMVFRIRSADELQRTGESVNGLLLVPVLAVDALG